MEVLGQVVKNEMRTIKYWFNEWSLTVKFKKTKFIPISCSYKNIRSYSTVYINTVSQSSSFALFKYWHRPLHEMEWTPNSCKIFWLLFKIRPIKTI